MIRKILLVTMIVFYFVNGVTHFIIPVYYIGMIPDVFSDKALINSLSGSIEIILAILLMFEKTRSKAAIGIILMLFAYVPAHLRVMNAGGCIPDSMCVSMEFSWIRLLFIQPVLLIWAFIVGSQSK